jgi:hypothetical protein
MNSMHNPYGPSASSHLLTTPKHESARRIVIGVAVFMVLQSLAFTGLKFLLSSATPETTQWVRVGLTLLLAIFLVLGSKVARYITIFLYSLFSISSAFALPAVYEKQGLVAVAFLGMIVLSNLAIPILLKAPAGMDEHFS